jgi:hypothetical protein
MDPLRNVFSEQNIVFCLVTNFGRFFGNSECVQIARFRQLLNRIDSVMQLEYQLMRRFVSRGSRSACLNFSFLISLQHMDGTKYVRCMECGHFIGLGRAIFTDDANVFDVIMNQDDYHILFSQQTRPQSSDCKVVLQSWDAVCAQLSLIADHVRTASCCFVYDNQVSTFVCSVNLDEQAVSEVAERTAKSMSHDLPEFRALRVHGILDNEVHMSSVGAQNYAFNCLPNVSVETDPSKKQSQAKYWQRQGTRHIVLRELIANDLTLNIVESAVQHAEECRNRYAESLTVRSSTSSRTRSITPSRRQRMRTAVDSGNEDNNIEPIAFDVEKVGSDWHSFPSMQSKSLVSRLRSSLIAHGLFRLLRNDETGIDVIWNAYDDQTGRMRHLQFCTTSVRFMQTRDSVYVCEHCASFKHSKQLSHESDSDGAVDGYCAHTILLRSLIPHLTVCGMRAPAPRNDRFVVWMDSCQRTGDSIVRLFDEGGLGKYFVKVEDGVARAESTSEVAICCVFMTGNRQGRLSCSVGRCVEVTMKRVKKVVEREKLCCHLRALFDHESYAHLWTAQQLEEDGFDVCGTKELDAAMQTVEGTRIACSIRRRRINLYVLYRYTVYNINIFYTTLNTYIYIYMCVCVGVHF